MEWLQALRLLYKSHFHFFSLLLYTLPSYIYIPSTLKVSSTQQSTGKEREGVGFSAATGISQQTYGIVPYDTPLPLTFYPMKPCVGEKKKVYASVLWFFSALVGWLS